MASANQDVIATDATDNVRLVSTPLWVPLFWSHGVTLWFQVLKSQFEAARITSDEVKFHITVASLTEQQFQLIRDVLLNQPMTGHYDRLKYKTRRLRCKSAQVVGMRRNGRQYSVVILSGPKETRHPLNTR